MKIKSEKKEYQVLGATSKTFSVDTNDTMVIKLLRDKMYKNKIGAVAREISSNSRDANREAGRGDTPIVISIDNDSNLLSSDTSSISFQDNGVGITPERMDNIFLKYGGSTKRDTDEYTGGFGIGAKTPFAYTDNFYISTVVEEKGKRVEYLYQAIITSDGKNEVSRMIELGSSETQDQTGTKITVPLKTAEDRVKFEKEIIYCTNFWKVKPILKGFIKKHKTQMVFEDENCIIFKNSNQRTDDNAIFNTNTKIIALIDEIPYQVNGDTLENELGVKIPKANSNKWLLKFNTGEITVSGSREDIEYVETNLKNIYSKTQEVANKGLELLKDYQAKATNYLEACVLAETLRTSMYSYYSNNQNNQILEKLNVDMGYVKFIGETIEYKKIGISNDSDDLIFPSFEGVKTVGQFNFSTFDVRHYELDNNGRMKQLNGYYTNNVQSKVWSGIPAYELDLAKIEPTRTARLKLNHSETGYVLIKKLNFDEFRNKQYSNKNVSKLIFDERKKADEKTLELLGMELTLYSEVEKLKKEKSGNKNTTDIVGVNVRVLQKVAYENSWGSLTINYDKKGEVFIEALPIINQNTTDEVNVTSFCYIEKAKLSDFKVERWSNREMINGIPTSLDAVRRILLANGVQTLGISSSKAGYFKNVPTIQEALALLIKNDKSNKILNTIKASIIEQSGLQHSEFLSEINAKQSVKSSINNLCEIYNEVKQESQNCLSVKTMLNIFKGKVDTKFLDTLNIQLDKDFENDLKLANKCLENNPILKLILQVKNSSRGYAGGVRLENNSTEFKAIEKSFIDTCKVK
jgi:hypothetical protein